MNFDNLQVAMNKTREMHIVSLTLQETGTYNPQHLRPFHTTVDAGTLNVLAERFAANPARAMVGAHELSDVTGSILAPSTRIEGNAEIPNTWAGNRLRFTLHAHVEYQAGGRGNIFVFGYTDYNGFQGLSSMSSMQAIDPNMTFYVNSVIQTRESFRMGASGHRESYWAPFAADHIHTGPHSANEFHRDPNKQFLLRPVDVYQTNEIPFALEEANFGASRVHDARNTLSGRALSSRRANGLPSAFAANVLQAQLQAIPLAANSTQKSDIHGTAAGFVQENPVQGNPFLKAISAQRGEHRTSNQFSFKDLTALDPNTYNNTRYITHQGGLSTMHRAGQTQYWGGEDISAVTATTLAHAVPAIMTSLGLTTAQFSSTNNTHMGVPVSLPLGGNTITGSPIAPLMAQFISRLDTELIKAITHNNQLSYTINMSIDLFGDTWIKLQISDQPEYDYVAPSFSDSLFAPTVTSDHGRVQKMAHDFGSIVDTLKSALGQSDAHSFDTSF